MGEKYLTVTVEKYKGLIGKTSDRWEDNIKVDLRKLIYEGAEQMYRYSCQRAAVGSSEWGNKPAGLKNRGKF
jgi:hypothetical protein